MEVLMKNKLMLIGLSAMSVGLQSNSYDMWNKPYYKNSDVPTSGATNPDVSTSVVSKPSSVAVTSFKTCKNAVRHIYLYTVSFLTGAKDGIVYSYKNPNKTVKAGYTYAKDFTSKAGNSALEAGKFVNKKTFGKDLGFFKYDGAVATTVVLAGIGYGSYKVYQNGYVSKLKNRLFGKFETPVIAEVEKAAPIKVPSDGKSIIQKRAEFRNRRSN